MDFGNFPNLERLAVYSTTDEHIQQLHTGKLTKLTVHSKSHIRSITRLTSLLDLTLIRIRINCHFLL